METKGIVTGSVDVSSAKGGFHVEESIDWIGHRNSGLGARFHRRFCACRVQGRRRSPRRGRWRRVARCWLARSRLAWSWLAYRRLASRWLGLARSGCRGWRGFGSCQRSRLERQRSRLGAGLGLGQWLEQRRLGRQLGRWMHAMAPGLDWLGLAHGSGERLLVKHRKTPRIEFLRALA